MIACPYSAIQLQISSLSLDKKLKEYLVKNVPENATPEMEQEFLGAKMEEWFQELGGAAGMPGCAKHHGITVEQLLASPNMNELQAQYQQVSVERVVDLFKRHIGLDDREAWAFMAYATNTPVE